MSTRQPSAAEQQSSATDESQPEVALPPAHEDDFLEYLTGDWAGKYVFGEVEFDATAEVRWAFNHQFVRGINMSRGSVGLAESQEIWQPTDEEGKYRVWWFDSWGNAGVAEGESTPTGFIIHGDDPLFGSFRNVGTRNGSDELQFSLETGPDEDGEYTQIGGGYYRRVTS
ncbi:MAG: hypothetical protein PVG07_03860 [Acidobacteriota bacterium]|jgi:hypothetical protein